MKTWREMFYALPCWFRFPNHSEPNADLQIALLEEIQAVLELTLCTATGAVAQAKLLERELDQQKQNPQQTRQVQRLSQELTAVRSEVEHLRQSLSRIRDLFTAAQSRVSLAASRAVFEESSQLFDEVVNPRELDELENELFSNDD